MMIKVSENSQFSNIFLEINFKLNLFHEYHLMLFKITLSTTTHPDCCILEDLTVMTLYGIKIGLMNKKRKRYLEWLIPSNAITLHNTIINAIVK